MASRNLNKVMLIGNLTRDPELRYTPQGNAVASFVVATNREWVSQGERKQSADFHNVVAWNKLAEICSQLLTKGIKVYVEGRLQTRDWVGDDGKKRYKTEIVIDDMIVLTPKGDAEDDVDMDGLNRDDDEVSHGSAEEGMDLEGLDLDDVDFDAISTDVEEPAEDK
ncbi:single-stranded DNA-binding protein [Patescibacteria group bacterium]|nr:single-stranded DNA-binding protein [Patescibacteria group bacterium]